MVKVLKFQLQHQSFQWIFRADFLQDWLVWSSCRTNLCMCAQSFQCCPTLWAPTNCSLPGSSIHEIFQARILEWVAMPSSRGSSWLRDWTCISYIAGRFFTAESLGSPQNESNGSQMPSVEVEGKETESLYLTPSRKFTMKNENVKYIGLGSRIKTKDGRSGGCKHLL